MLKVHTGQIDTTTMKRAQKNEKKKKKKKKKIKGRQSRIAALGQPATKLLGEGGVFN